MTEPWHIVLIEDSRADVKILERALAESGVAHRLTVFTDGHLALDYLADLDVGGPAEGRPPDVVLLDLNLPGLDGLEVLRRIKSHPTLRAVPVVVLTTSGREEDVLRSYMTGANSFIQKPAEFDRYRDMVETLRSYWRGTVVLPPWDRPPA